jgi:hypothetical protein
MTPEHRRRLAWFEEHQGEVSAIPGPLEDGLILVSKPKGNIPQLGVKLSGMLSPDTSHWRGGMTIPTSLPDLPDPATVTDAKTASDALSRALAAAATASESRSAESLPGAELKHPPEKDGVPFEQLWAWFRKFHELLVKVASNHDQLISWSVTVGTPFNLTLTVNFADRDHAQPTR